MSYHILPAAPFDCIVIGGTGDLARRKLLPALYQRFADGQIPDDCRVIGASRRAMSDADYQAMTRLALTEFIDESDRDDATMERFVKIVSYITLDAASGEDWRELAAVLAPNTTKIRAFYLAVGPDLFDDICARISEFDLVTACTRVVIEKPIGRDLESARMVNDAIARAFTEDQIFRIDHYLGKETVQNLMVLRFANMLYEPLWNSAHIDHVQITVAESIGVGSRGGYYDGTGALRDMIQNHMLQLLCLVTMEPPDWIDANSVRDEKLKVLKALKPVDRNNAASVSVRGQYRAGAADNGAVPAYVEELQTNHSDTETFVALKAEVANWRWAGVPVYMRTGKRLPERVSEIVIAFKPIPHSIFPTVAGTIHTNKLVIRLQPDEGVKQWIMIKDPSSGDMQLRHVPLDMSFAEAFDIRHPEAYERLLLDVIRGNQTLFMRRDEVEAAWAWIDPILEAWDAARIAPSAYTAGTWGPSASIALIERDGRTWHEDTL